jgi:hypothetical protein
MQLNDININPFTEATEEDDDDGDVEPPDVLPQAPPVELFKLLPPETLGNEQYCINERVFIHGLINEDKSLERFRNFSLVQLVLHLSQGFFNLLQECTNEKPDARITMKDLYCYHAALVLITTVRMDKVEYYWNPPKVFQFIEETAKLRSIFTLYRYYHVRVYLRAYKMEDNVPDKGLGWKVVRATEEIHRIFSETIDCRDQDISIDEDIAAACSTRNPIFTTPLKAYLAMKWS